VSGKDEEFKITELGKQLDAAFRTRAVWLLFLGADPRVSFGAVAKAITVSQQHVDHIALITPSVEKATGCMAVSLPLGFKEHSR
jgi:biopolymer transport protein ExbD